MMAAVSHWEANRQGWLHPFTLLSSTDWLSELAGAQGFESAKSSCHSLGAPLRAIHAGST
jgi:hypothetical protein